MPDTQILPIEGQPTRFSIKIKDQSVVIFTADSQEIAMEWILALRSATFRNANLTIDDFTIISVIGRGFYGKVMLVEKEDSHALYAIKTVHKSRLVKSRKVHTILGERNILAKSDYPFIVKLYFAFQTDTKFYLGLEYVPGGELFKYYKEQEYVPIEETKLYIAEITLAINYLHSIGVIYRDLKPENLLVGEDGHIKLTDFGLSKDLTLQNMTNTFCGTSEYLAPEIIKREPYDYMIDWWSLGVLSYELIFGHTPFCNKNRAKMFSNIISESPSFPPTTDKDTIDFISILLSKDPKRRGKFEDIKDHPFFKDYPLDKVEKKLIQPKYVPNIMDPKEPVNFDSEFTQEVPQDSMATPTYAPDGTFDGFSFMGIPDARAPALQKSTFELDADPIVSPLNLKPDLSEDSRPSSDIPDELPV